MSKSAKIIHIGLGKCASTFLQECWNSDPKIKQVDLGPLAQELRKRISNGISDISNVKLHIPTVSNTVIASSEGMTWGWFNQPDKQALLSQYRALGADVICKNHSDARIFLMIKNPIKWIRSAHQQAVKEGFPDTCDKFLLQQEKVVSHVLDLNRLLKNYDSFGSEITILSSDELGADPDTFWTRYEKSLGIKRPSHQTVTQISRDKNRLNSSLNTKRLASYIELTRSDFDKVRRYLVAISHNGHLKRESKNIGLVFMNHSSIIHRRILEHADDNSVRALDPDFDRRDPAPYVDFTITPGLRDHLLRNFCEPLNAIDTIPSDLIADYEQSLRETTAR